MYVVYNSYTMLCPTVFGDLPRIGGQRRDLLIFTSIICTSWSTSRIFLSLDLTHYPQLMVGQTQETKEKPALVAKV